MRRTLLIIWSAILMSTSAYAWNQIPFTVGYEKDDMPIGHGHAKSPMRPPVVYMTILTTFLTLRMKMVRWFTLLPYSLL